MPCGLFVIFIKLDFNTMMLKSNLLHTIAPSVIVTLIGFVLAYQFVDPAPPKNITIGTGDKQGAYFLFGNRYREFLQKEGVDLFVRSTAGSVENLDLLSAEQALLDVAFIQGGVHQGEAAQGLFSLGSLYYEPLWVFTRGAEPIHRIADLRGKRVANGPVGSGTQKLVAQVLAINGLSAENTQLVPLGNAESIRRLQAGSVDAIFLVASARSPVVKQLLSSPGVHLMNFARADAYARNLRFLSTIVLPEGAIDLQKNIPHQDTVLLAATVNLVVREELHPALVDLLLQAAQTVHAEGGWFEKVGQFPSAENLDFPISPDAQRFYRYGPPFLQRYLPFWAASFVDRMKVLLLPLVALLIPFMKIMPPIYRWRMRSKIYRWYRELQEIDLGLFHEVPAPENHYRQELDRIEHEVVKVDVPLSFADQLFDLRLHIEMIRRRLNTRGELRQGRSGLK